MERGRRRQLRPRRRRPHRGQQGFRPSRRRQRAQQSRRRRPLRPQRLAGSSPGTPGATSGSTVSGAPPGPELRAGARGSTWESARTPGRRSWTTSRRANTLATALLFGAIHQCLRLLPLGAQGLPAAWPASSRGSPRFSSAHNGALPALPARGLLGRCPGRKASVGCWSCKHSAGQFGPPWSCTRCRDWKREPVGTIDARALPGGRSPC